MCAGLPVTVSTAGHMLSHTPDVTPGRRVLVEMPACTVKGLTVADRSCLHDGIFPLLYPWVAPSPECQSHLFPLLQARLTYELAMANRDASSMDENLAKDFDDRLSDDSSGEHNQDPCCILMSQQQRLLHEHLTLGQGRQGTDAIQLWADLPLTEDISLASPLMQSAGVENIPRLMPGVTGRERR